MLRLKICCVGLILVTLVQCLVFPVSLIVAFPDFPYKLSPAGLCIYDAERVKDSYYIFDALMSAGQDIRHLPLAARLRAAQRSMPPKCFLKRFFHASQIPLQQTIERLMRGRARLNGGERIEALEGFIFSDLMDPYTEPPQKFKFHISCDFQIVSAHVRGRFDLYVYHRAELARFLGSRSVPAVAIISDSEAATLGLNAKNEISKRTSEKSDICERHAQSH